VFDLGSRAAVEPLENPFTILRSELVQKLVSTDGSGLNPRALFPENGRHGISKFAAVGDAYRSPFARPTNRALPSPPPRDDEEIIPTEDRPRMLAARPDAAPIPVEPRPTD
jgi:hypothetical protein